MTHALEGRVALRRTLAAAATLVLALTTACSDPSTPIPVASGIQDQAALAKAPANKNSLNVTVGGLPTGTAAAVTVSGPAGYRKTLTATTSLTGLADGTYTIAGSNVTTSGGTYSASPASQTISVRKGVTANITVTYAVVPTTGALTVTITPAEATPAAVTVTGPNAYSQAVTTTTSLSNLAPGTYTVAAAAFTTPTGVNYAPVTASQTASVTAGATSGVTVTYQATNVPPTPGFNLQILGMYLTQSVQTLANDVPLVTGRDGVLRVFALANASNTVQPAVRVRLYHGGSLAATYTIPAPSTSVPTVLNEASATASWNVAIPGALITPGMAVLADVDPSSGVAESDEADNAYPSSGAPYAFTVRTVPNLAVRFVPVLQSGSGLQGSISDATVPGMMQQMLDVHPLNTYSYNIRAPYTTSTAILSDGTGWSPVLSELYALRRTDASSEHYYGVVKTGYSSGVVGIGYIGAPTSMGWDVSSGGWTMAHEFGHNWGRYHAPCGGVAGPDANFPYAGGIAGVYGWNVRTNTLITRTTADLMGYCSPKWISDYTYKAVLTYRGYSTTAPMVAMGSAVEPGVLVWGRIAADGSITLEPSFRLVARPSVPTGTGAYTLQGTDASGAAIFSYAFDPEVTDDDAGPAERHFAFVIPMSDAAQARLHGLTVSGNGRSASRASSLGAAALQGVSDGTSADAEGATRARVRWNAAPNGAAMVLVRDAQSGEVLSFARGGDVSVATGQGELELVTSDGVRSVARRVRVRGR